jgi:hypothetical protein
VTQAAAVSCHLERPLDDRAFGLFRRLQGRFPVAALIRPPHPGEDEERWLERARELAAHGPLGHHTHWTSPTHARPTGGDPGAKVREEAAWLAEHGLEPTLFCGGGWYSDEGVRAAVAELGYADCTPRDGEPRREDGRVVIPTTHSLGALAKAVLWRLDVPVVHAYFHDYDLLDRRRRDTLVAALYLLRLRRGLTDLDRLAAEVRHGANPP